MTHPTIYRPSFQRHLYSLAISDFYARYLDADDHAFLERVRRRGIANGDVPRGDVVSPLDEIEFWGAQYAVENRAAPAPKRVQPPQVALRLAMRKARRVSFSRDAEAAITRAELEREQREQAAAIEVRRQRDLQADADWEAAAPKGPWRETPEAEAARLRAVERALAEVEAAKEGERRKAERAANARRRRAMRKAAEEAQRVKAEAEAARLRREHQARAEQAAGQARAAAVALQRGREAVERAKQTLAQDPGWPRAQQAAVEGMKDLIATRVRSAPTYPWTAEALMRAIGCTDESVMQRCLDEMVRDGKLQRNAA